MTYSIKKHEVDRLVSFAVMLGWLLKEEKYGNGDIEVVLTRKISPELLKAAGEIEKPSSPQ